MVAQEWTRNNPTHPLSPLQSLRLFSFSTCCQRRFLFGFILARPFDCVKQKRVEFHYIPKDGSWLNMAEIETAILQRNTLSRRLPDEAALRKQVSAVETERNTNKHGTAWQFTSRDARRKLERLYPVKAV